MRAGLRIGRAVPAAVAAAAVLSLGAAAAGSAPAPRTVTIATIVSETSFNPFKNETGYFLQYLEPVYDTLIRRDPDGSFSADLATAWSYKPGSKNKVFVLTLRKGVHFSDGTLLDAAAVKANLDYAKTAGGPRALQLASIASVSTPDAATVQLKLSRSDPSLPLTLSEVNGMMVDPKELLDPVSLDATPAGAGPYLLDPTQTVAGDHYTYVRNPRYWQPKAFAYDRIVIKVYADGTAAFDAARAGAVDMAPGAPADLALGRKAKLTALTWTANCLGVWLWDRGGKLLAPLAKLKVRQALNYALDRRAIFNSLYAGQGVPGTQIFVPGSAGHDPALDKSYPYDPEKARRLLAQAGYANGFTLPVLSVPAGDPQLKAVARYLKAVGVTVQIDDVAESTLANEIAKPRFPALMFTYPWQDAFQDSQAMVLPGGFFNPFGSKDDTISKLWSQAAAAPTGAQQAKLFRQESARIVQLAWFLIVGYDKAVYWVNPTRVAGVKPTVGQPVPSIFGWRPKS